MVDESVLDDETKAFVKEREDEYGEFVAIAPIDWNGVRAYNVGDPVPRSNVELHGYLGQNLVARKSTKAAKAATDPAKS